MHVVEEVLVVVLKLTLAKFELGDLCPSACAVCIDLKERLISIMIC